MYFGGGCTLGGGGVYIGSAYWSLDVEGVVTTSIMSSCVAGVAFPLMSLALDDPSKLAFFMTLISLSAASSLLFRWIFSLIRLESLGCLQQPAGICGVPVGGVTAWNPAPPGITPARPG